jgi:hypothetical protein
VADVEANVDITVEGAGSLAEAAAEAEALKEALDGDRDAALESGAAMEAMKHSASGAASQMGRLRDERGRFISQEADLAAIARAAQARLAGAAGALGGPSKKEQADAEKSLRRMQDLERDLAKPRLGDAEASMAGGGAIEKMRADLEKLRGDLAQAEPLVDRMGAALGDSGERAGIAATALGNYHGALRDFAEGHGDADTAIRASRELDGVLGDFGRTTEDATQGLQDLGQAGEDLGGGGGFLSSIGGLDGFGGAFGKAGGGAQSAAMPAAIVGLVSAITTIGPALAATGLGFASWGALAAPAILKVKDGLTSVTYAQQAYRQAAAVEKLDPTAANAKAEKAALDQLRATWATIPADVRPSVKAAQGLEHAFSQAGKPIQADALKDIPGAIKDIKGLLPALQGMAKATNPLVSGMIKDLGQFEKSSGFKGFVHNIESEIPGAVGPLKQLGGALGAVGTALFSKGNVKIGDQFLGSLAGFTKEFGPGTVKSLGSVAKDISTIMSATTKAANSPLGHGIGDLFSGMGKLSDFAWKKVPKAAAGIIGDTGKTGASVWDKILGIKPGTNLGSQVGGDAAKALKLGGKDAGSVKIKVSVDGAAKAKSDLKSLTDGAKPKPVKVQVSTSGADKAKSDLKGVSTAAQSVGHTKADLKIQLTGAQAAVTGLHQVGQAGTAMGTGVAAGASRASAATSAMAGSMRGAIAPLPGEFRAIGSQAGAGLAAGLASETGAVSSAAASLAAAAETAANIQLIIKSPSKKFQKIGENSALGYILGLEGGKSAVQKAMRDVLGTPAKNSTITSTVTALRKEIDLAAKDLKINPLQKMGLTQLLDQDNQKLQKLARERQGIENKIAAADALAKSVQQAAMQGADLGTIAASTTAGQQDAADSGSLDFALGSTQAGSAQNATMAQGLKTQLADVQKFNKQLKQLKKEGLDKAGIKELAGDGVQAGSEAASQILAGGQAGVRAIAQLDNSLGAASKKLGITAGNAAYEGASQVGGQLAAGLKSQLKVVNQEMDSLAKTLVTALLTGLGDSSKEIKAALAKLDKELGLSSGASGGSSGGGSKGKVTPPHIIYHHPEPKQKDRVVSPPHLPQQGSGGGGGTVQPVVVHNTTVVQVDGAEIARVVETKNLQHAKRRPTTYPTLPGRG